MLNRWHDGDANGFMPSSGKGAPCKNDLDRTNWGRGAAVRDLLGVMMPFKKQQRSTPSVLDVVALLSDIPGQGLARGQVGTIVEQLDESTSLVEFSDDDGRAYAIVPCPHAQLLVLHYVPETA